MKILQVTNLFSPLHGGSAEVPYQLSRELAKREHQVTIYTSDFRLKREYIAHIPEVKFHAFKSWVSLAGFQVTPVITAKAKEEIKHLDVIHMHNYRTFQNVVIHHYAKKYNIPYVLQAHGSLTTFFQKKLLKKLFDIVWGYRILRDASRVIAFTESEAEEYSGMGVGDDKIEVVPNGIDLAEFDNLPAKGEFKRKFDIAPDARVILYLGRIHQTKGIDLLAMAFAGLSKVLSNIRLVIAGPDEGYLSSLKKLIGDLEISDNVLFTGLLLGEDKLGAYVDADVHVSFRAWEPFGITLLESCACSTPVICSTGCGIADIIDNQAGFAVPYDKEQLQQALWRMLNDDELRLSFGEKGRVLVRERFSWGKIIEQIEAVYDSTRQQAGGEG